MNSEQVDHNIRTLLDDARRKYPLPPLGGQHFGSPQTLGDQICVRDTIHRVMSDANLTEAIVRARVLAVLSRHIF